MPATSSGTSYTVYTSAGTGYGTAAYAVADAHKNDTDIPTILYTHGAGGAYNQFATLAAWSGLRDWIIDHGGAWVEGSGGLTEAAGQGNWGNTGARAAYVAYLEWAATKIDIGPVIPLGRSMGGVIAPWLYLRSPIASQCAGMIVSSGVQTLTYGTRDSVNGALKPTGQYFGQAILDAYGAADYAEFVTKSADFDPMNFMPSLWDGKKVLQLVGTADATVPRAVRGADPLRAIYSGRLSDDRFDVREGGDHSQGNGTYLQVSAMTAFLTDIAFANVGPPKEPQSYRVLGHWLYQAGQRFAMTPTF
ncbi:alpha/beta hydrolase [Rhodococcus hoagii]|nr:alpha/beta hydrolase [Prescottella equi]